MPVLQIVSKARKNGSRKAKWSPPKREERIPPTMQTAIKAVPDHLRYLEPHYAAAAYNILAGKRAWEKWLSERPNRKHQRIPVVEESPEDRTSQRIRFKRPANRNGHSRATETRANRAPFTASSKFRVCGRVEKMKSG